MGLGLGLGLGMGLLLWSRLGLELATPWRPCGNMDVERCCSLPSS